jgi:AhpD family alkylhydroperoxidase
MIEQRERNQNETQETLAQIKETTNFLSKKFPGIMKAFYQSFTKVDDDGALSKKTKRLISLGGALIKQCDWCVKYYVNKCLEVGAAPDEILEASMVALKMNGGPGLMYVTTVIKTLQDLGKLD